MGINFVLEEGTVSAGSAGPVAINCVALAVEEQIAVVGGSVTPSTRWLTPDDQYYNLNGFPVAVGPPYHGSTFSGYGPGIYVPPSVTGSSGLDMRGSNLFSP
jgi:hypothetical protein